MSLPSVQNILVAKENIRRRPHHPIVGLDQRLLWRLPKLQAVESFLGQASG